MDKFTEVIPMFQDTSGSILPSLSEKEIQDASGSLLSLLSLLPLSEKEIQDASGALSSLLKIRETQESQNSQDVSGTFSLLSSLENQIQVLRDASGTVLWQSYIDCLQKNLSIQQFLSSEELNFIQSICTDVNGSFLHPIYVFLSSNKNLNFVEASKLIIFIYKKIKETNTNSGTNGKNIQNLLEYIVYSFIDSNLLMVENKEEIKKYTKELSELLESKHIIPAIKMGCSRCILC